MKMSLNLDVVVTCMTQTPLMATHSRNVYIDIDMLCALVLNGVGGEVDDADVVTVDESALYQRRVELLK
jgi:hypothetical protein